MSVFPFKKAAVTLLLLTAAYFSGFGIHYLFSQPTTVLPASSSSEGNWGLSFQEEGVRPVGNATPSELAKYQAAYADETVAWRMAVVRSSGIPISSFNSRMASTSISGSNSSSYAEIGLI